MKESEWAKKLGRGIWWEPEKLENGKTQDRMENIPNVMKCFCGSHPMPIYPPAIYSVNDEDMEVLLAGVPRSGNTVTWQILNSLLDGKVIRTHGFRDSCPVFYGFKKVIVTVRNPYDVAYSLQRVGWYSKERNQEIWDDMKKFVSLKRFQQVMGYRSDLDLVFLKYEDVWNKPKERINFLSSALEINLSNNKILDIISHTSIEKNIERSEKQKIVSDQAGKRIQDENKINPEHIGSRKGVPGQGKNLSSWTKQEVLRTCSWAFDCFGYEK